MAKEFLGDDFLLHTPTAKTLFHDHAKGMEIFDYHCHLPVEEISSNKKFANLTAIWLYGDHYKWRAMRANGIDEKFITGDASDRDKFRAWARTVPQTLRNPLYHWTHMELRNPFGIQDLLSEKTADKIYDACEEMLQKDEFSTQGLLRKMKVKVVCTTDDPIDDLKHHKQMAGEDFGCKVYPAWRPDKGMAVEDAKSFNEYVGKVEATSGVEVKDFKTYVDAIRKRHAFFHENGCRLSDHGIENIEAAAYTDAEISAAFAKIRSGKELDATEIEKFRSCMLYEFAVLDAEAGWVQQYHVGAYRNVNSSMVEKLGRDTGFDSMGDFDQGRGMGRLFDRLDREGKLAPTIVYNLNPVNNALLATMAGNFNDGKTPGKMQFGMRSPEPAQAPSALTIR